MLQTHGLGEVLTAFNIGAHQTHNFANPLLKRRAVIAIYVVLMYR